MCQTSKELHEEIMEEQWLIVQLLRFLYTSFQYEEIWDWNEYACVGTTNGHHHYHCQHSHTSNSARSFPSHHSIAVTGVSNNLSSSSSSSSDSSHNGNTITTNTKETTTDAVRLPNHGGRLLQVVMPPHEFMAKLREKCERLVRYTCIMQVKVAALLMLCYPLRYWASAVNLHYVGDWELASISLSNSSYHMDKDKKSKKMDRTNGNHFHSGSNVPYLPNWDQLFDEKMREETNKRKTMNQSSSQVTANHDNAKVEASVQAQNGVSENTKTTNNKAVSTSVETHTQSKNVKPTTNEKHKHGIKNNGKANRNRK